MTEKKHWIQSAVDHPGVFTRKAEEAGMAVQQFAHHVLAHPSNYSEETRRQAQLAETFAHMHHKK